MNVISVADVMSPTFAMGSSFEKLFSIAALTQSAAATRMTLIRWTILQYLIGNSDAHGKNLSFLVEPGGLRLAPAYDLGLSLHLP